MKFSRFHSGLFALGITILLSISATESPYRDQHGLQVGERLPAMKLSDRLHLGSKPNSSEGERLTLIHFWAAYDAESRARNVTYDRYLSSTVSDRIAYKAISLDREQSIFAHTVNFDGLDADQQHLASGLRGEILSRYKLRHDLHTYLVDSNGQIISVDPTTDELEYFYHH